MFEFEVGDLVECMVKRMNPNRSMLTPTTDPITRHIMLAVIIDKNIRPILSPTGESKQMTTIYKIHRADGKITEVNSGIYPIGHFKDEV